jgi:ribosomal protein S21
MSPNRAQVVAKLDVAFQASPPTNRKMVMELFDKVSDTKAMRNVFAQYAASDEVAYATTSGKEDMQAVWDWATYAPTQHDKRTMLCEKARALRRKRAAPNRQALPVFTLDARENIRRTVIGPASRNNVSTDETLVAFFKRHEKNSLIDQTKRHAVFSKMRERKANASANSTHAVYALFVRLDLFEKFQDQVYIGSAEKGAEDRWFRHGVYHFGQILTAIASLERGEAPPLSVKMEEVALAFLWLRDGGWSTDTVFLCVVDRLPVSSSRTKTDATKALLALESQYIECAKANNPEFGLNTKS